jgi:hypothetical protein
LITLHYLGFLGRRDSSRVFAKVLAIYGLEFFKIPSHYHKSGDFQDNTANREFLRANSRLGIQIVRDFRRSIFRILWQYLG